MSMNIENVDLEYRQYIFNRDQSLSPFRFSICDWPSLAKSLVHHGIDVNTMKVIKMYCGGVDFKTFIKDKDGIIAFRDERWDNGYKQFEGLYHIDTNKLKGGCYYGGFRSLVNTISSQNQHIKHFNNVKYCWYIPRNDQQSLDLSTKKEVRKQNKDDDETYCWNGLYTNKIGPGVVNAINRNGYEIAKQRLEFIKGELEIFANSTINRSIEIDPISSLDNLKNNIAKIIGSIRTIIDEQHNDTFNINTNQELIVRTFTNYLTDKTIDVSDRYNDPRTYDIVYRMYKNMINLGSMITFSDKVIEMYRGQYGTK